MKLIVDKDLQKYSEGKFTALERRIELGKLSWQHICEGVF